MASPTNQPHTDVVPLLPDPTLLRQYRDILGDEGLHRVLTNIETRTTNRFKLDSREQRIQETGQWFSFILGLVAIGGGLWVSLTQPLAGAAVSGGTVLSMVVAFLKYRKPPKGFS